MRVIALMGVAIVLAGLPAIASDWVLPKAPARSHPRLVQSAEELKQLRANPGAIQAARKAAEVYFSKTRTSPWKDYGSPVPQTQMPPRHEGYNWPYWTPIAAEIRAELEALSYAYTLTNDRKYFDRVRTELLSLAQWERWYDTDACYGKDSPCLDTFYLTYGVSIAYDYLHSTLTPADRDAIRHALVEKGIQVVYRRTNDPVSFVQLPSRWPNGYAMDNAALGFGALAVWGEEPDAPMWLARAIDKVELFMREQANDDGSLLEGFFYGAASIDPIAAFDVALKNNAGVNLLGHPYFRRAHEFPMYFLIPGSNWLLGFGDNGGPRGTQPLLQGTIGLLAKEGLADAHAKWYLQQAWKTPEVHPDYLKAIQQGMFYALRRTTPYRELNDATVNALSVAAPEDLPRGKAFRIGWVAMRSGWSADDTLVGFRSGGVVGHAHLDQNNLLIASRGHVLLSDPGYQRFDMKYPDEPNRDLTHQEHLFSNGSEGHNVLLVDGLGQSKVETQLRSFFTSHALNYVAGEASAAYPGLDQFTRHVVQLPGASTVIAYDQVATDGPKRKIDWLFHTTPSNDWQVKDGGFVVQAGGAQLTASFPLRATALQTRANPAADKTFAKTLATQVEASRADLLSVFETGATGAAAKSWKAKTEAGGRSVTMSSQTGTDALVLTPDGGAFDTKELSGTGRVAYLRSAGDRTEQFALVEGTFLHHGAAALVAASRPVSVGVTVEPSAIRADVAATGATVLSLTVGTVTAVEVDGIALDAKQYSAGEGRVTLNLPAGEHVIVMTK